MMSKDYQTYQRAIGAALLGLAVQFVMAMILLYLWGQHGQNTALEIAWYFDLIGLPVWVCLAMVFQQHKLERQESLEYEQIAARHGTDSSIFETSGDELAVKRRQLARLYKWVVPLVSLLTGGLLIGFGLLHASFNASRVTDLEYLKLPEQTLVVMFVVATLAVICFLISRYLAGMAKVPQWVLLRGGASFIMGGVLIKGAIVLGFALANWGAFSFIHYLSLIIPVFMIVIGAEMLLTFILDFYRPRKADESPRPAFDSRLLNLATNPESVAKTINEAIDFQFGFKITDNWFWQLLSMWFWRLVGIAVVVMLLMSTMVFVQPHQEAVVTTFGALPGDKALAPGMHFKMPWPFQKVEYYDVTDVRTIRLGSHQFSEEEQAKLEAEEELKKPILWSNDHGGKEVPMIVAPPPINTDDDAPASLDPTQDTGKAPSISLVNIEVIIQYRIGDLVQYIRHNADAEAHDAEARDQRLHHITMQTVSRTLLRGTIDEWIGTSRVGIGQTIAEEIQKATDAQNLGVKVLNVSVASVHPPQEVADAFHEVVNAEQEQQTTVERAKESAVETMVEVAGSVGLGEMIVAEIERYEQLAAKPDVTSEDVLKQEVKIEELLRQAGGAASQEIAQASGYRWNKENAERGKAERFVKQRIAFKNAPKLYMAREYFAALEEGLPDRRKFLLVGERGETIIRGDFKDTTADIDDVLQQAIEKRK